MIVAPGGKARDEGVRRRAKACEGVRRHAKACEGVRRRAKGRASAASSGPPTEERGEGCAKGGMRAQARRARARTVVPLPAQAAVAGLHPPAEEEGLALHLAEGQALLALRELGGGVLAGAGEESEHQVVFLKLSHRARGGAV